MESRPLIYWLVIFCTWTVIRVFFPSSELGEELILKPLLWLGPLYFFWSTIPKISKETFLASLRNVQPIISTLIIPFIGTAVYALLMNLSTIHLSSRSLSAVALIIVTNTSTAIVEEIVFRGVLYNWFRATTGEIATFILVQVLFFAIHIPVLLLHSTSFPAGVLHALFIIVMGAVYTLLYTKTRSLPASIISHAVWNSASVLLSLA